MKLGVDWLVEARGARVQPTVGKGTMGVYRHGGAWGRLGGNVVGRCLSSLKLVRLTSMAACCSSQMGISSVWRLFRVCLGDMQTAGLRALAIADGAVTSVSKEEKVTKGTEAQGGFGAIESTSSPPVAAKCWTIYT